MSAATSSVPQLAPSTVAALRAVFDAVPQIRQVWLYGSWARGDARRTSDIDLAIDAPALDRRGFDMLATRVDELGLLRRIDLVHWQTLDGEPALRERIERDRMVFWPTAGAPTDVRAPMSTPARRAACR